MEIQRDMKLQKLLDDIKFKNLLESIFVEKADVDLSQPNVIAAMITAASKMFSSSDNTNSSEISMSDIIRTEVLKVYEKSDDEMINNLIGMGPQYVESAIGYSVDFMDWGSARLTYESDKEKYDELYKEIMRRYKSHEIEKGRSL